jgi:hypothetical protein
MPPSRLQNYSTLPHPKPILFSNSRQYDSLKRMRSLPLGGKLPELSLQRTNTSNAYIQKRLSGRRSRLIGSRAQHLYLPTEVMTNIIANCVSLEEKQPLYSYPARLFRNFGPLLLASRRLRSIALVCFFLETHIVCTKSWPSEFRIMKKEKLFNHVRYEHYYFVSHSYISND